MPKGSLLSILLFVVTSISFTLVQNAYANVSAIASSKQALAMIQSGCSIKPEQLQEIERLKYRIVSADNLSLARELALKPTGDALSALDKAKYSPRSAMTSPQPTLV